MQCVKGYIYMEYKEITRGGEAIVVEKKSRFIAYVEKAATEEEAVAYIEKIKKENYDARHNCFAYSVGEGQPNCRFSDDGEPQGTAGKPILEVINGSEIKNICIVVTRYFGGTLLGTGGLVRAYTEAAKQGIEQCQIGIKTLVIPIAITTEYSDMGNVQYILENGNVSVENKDYLEKVKINAFVSVDNIETVLGKLVEVTSGKIVIEKSDEIYKTI